MGGRGRRRSASSRPETSRDLQSGFQESQGYEGKRLSQEGDGGLK